MRANEPVNRLLDGMTRSYDALSGGPNAGQDAALKQLFLRQAFHEASTLAYADACRTIVAAFIVTARLVTLMQKIAAPKAPPAGAH